MDKQLKTLLDFGTNMVFFGGAGVSTESGIPDFRSEEGLYNAREKYGYLPEYMLSHSFFLQNPATFFKYYKENLIYEDALPNSCHYALARLEEEGRLKAVVTQNIDGLHQKAGSKNVLELHGSITRNYCTSCGAFYDEKNLFELLRHNSIPKCTHCGGMVKPDVVLYEEALDEDVIHQSIRAISQADVLIVAGTSLVVYPAAGLINYYKGDKLVLINKSSTQYDERANLVIHEPVGRVLSDYCNKR